VNMNKKLLSLALAGMLSLPTLALADISRDDLGNYALDYDKTPYDQVLFADRTVSSLISSQGNGLFDMNGFMNSTFGQSYATLTGIRAAKGWAMSEADLAYYTSIGLTKEKHYTTEGDENTAYYTYVPVNAAEGETFPLVVCNHGGGSNASSCEGYGWCEKAAAERLMVVMAEDVSVESLHTILATVKAEYPVNASRVYMVGNSMGGMMSRAYAGAYPEEIAAIGPVSNSFVFTENDGDMEKLAQMKMPAIFVAGNADVHNVLPVAALGSPITGTMDSWNNLMKVHNIEGYDMTQEESNKLIMNSMNAAEHYAGVHLPQDIIVHEYVNCRDFQVFFTGTDGLTTLSLVIGENQPHYMLKENVDLMWDFMKQFGRNQETGELMLLD